MTLSSRDLRVVSLVALAATALPFAIAGHVIAEMAALPNTSFLSVLLSPRHAYFAVLLLMALAGLAGVRSVFGRLPLQTVTERVIRSLPFDGRGIPLAGLTFGFCMAFFGATQVIEGSPMSTGDVTSGTIVGLVAASLTALLFALFKRPLIAFALLVVRLSAKPAAGPAVSTASSFLPRFPGRRGAFLSSIASRPPPATAVFAAR